MANAGWPDGSPGRPATGRVAPPEPARSPSVPHPRPPGATVYGGSGGGREPGATVYGGAPPGPPTPPGASRKRKRVRLVVLIAVVLVLAGLGSAAVLRVQRALPAAKLTATVASSLRIPGSALSLPWPSTGSAELMIDGLGRLGGTNGAKSAPIGSVAKVMTAYLVLKSHPLTAGQNGPEITVTAADVADYQQRILTSQSLVPVTVGETMTERDALEALLLPSANNVAHMLAVWVGGSADAFIATMNQTATELGMTGTHYTDPSGFLPSTVSTAADQVALARAALKLPVFPDIVALHSARIPVAGTVPNYNYMLGVDGVFGIKTGSTTQAGGNLVFAAHLTVGGTTLTVVGAVFNQPGASSHTQLTAVNVVVRKLLAAVRTAVREYTILAAKPVGRVTTAWGQSVTVSPAAPLRVLGWPGLAVPVKVTQTAPGAQVTQGQVVGSVEARPGAATTLVPLRADAPTDPPSFWWKLTHG